MNSEAVSALIAKNPPLKAAKAQLEAMEPGAYVIHRSWGFGRIKDYDEAAQRLIIDFKNKKGHAMDPAFCLTTMEILPANHLLVRKETDPKQVAELIAENPVQLVVETLQTYDNHATTAIDLEITLGQVIGEDKFKKWWAATKKALAKDPRISVPQKKTECYVLRETPVSAEDEILEQFNSTRSARRRITLAEELIEAIGKKEINTDLSVVLTGVAEAVKSSNQLDPSERLYGAAVRDELARHLGIDPATFEPQQPALVANARDLPAIAEKIPVHFQARFLELVNATHPIEGRDILFNLLKTSQGKFTTECINFLVEQGHADELAAVLKRWQTEQNLRAPVLLWIVKNRHSKKFAKLLNDLITPRLLGAIFFAIDYEALQASSARRIPLADILSDDTELIADLLSTADPETARDLANTLMLNQGFEELTKKSLLARFIKIFPKIQTLVDSEAETREEQLIVSKASYERKREEYETIVSKKIPENSKAIAAAREHGDLRENSEYKMAKQEQQVLMAHKTNLERDLGRARISDFKDASIDQVSVGTVVEVASVKDGHHTTYTVLGAWDGDPEKHFISYKTPFGAALLGKKTGDVINVKTDASDEDYAIVSIARYADKAS
ncbi:transcription elongation factor GreA [Opitutus terrae]|uniref:Transcription elongation factor GreA n=1 Tax=Opitutus terrae (strain DSM 11246 / JCM 15787 / PB90-1) TaxID=452637 RepID=B1ZZX3_OPITP|nr:transcription elongation factor GreA [Opitutus terrae]ACB77306.1 GreA/GreB family elongation factor [Opitutus terrae PB90-1]